MKKPLQSGDKVAVYGCDGRRVGKLVKDYMHTHSVTLLEDVAAELRALLRGGKEK